jgi:transmembrane sensor
MEGEPHAASDRASREASEWFVYLQDDPADTALRRRFQEWLRASAENDAAWAETVRASSLAESLLPFDSRTWGAVGAGPGKGQGMARAADRERSAFIGPKPAASRAWMRPRPIAAAAAAVAACVLALAAPAVLIRLQSDHVTGIAQTRNIELEDGSLVTLAPNSAVAVSYTPGERQVRLLSGEAYFAVRPNPAQPFRVEARTVRVTVLGTSFDVELASRSVGVAVNKGVVRVENMGQPEGDRSEQLTAGQSIRISSDGTPVRRGSQPADTAGAWRRGQLVMEDGPLGLAVEQLDRYFDGAIMLAGTSLADRPVTGIFDLRDPEAALRTIARALGLEVRRITPWILIVSAR